MTEPAPPPARPDSQSTTPPRARRCNADYRWTVPKVQAFLLELEKCGIVADAARAVGMSRQAAYALRARLDGPVFREAFEGARRMGLRARAEASRARVRRPRSRWDGPGLDTLDYLRAAPPAHADTPPVQADRRPSHADSWRVRAYANFAQAIAALPEDDADIAQADADPHKPTFFTPGPCNTRSMSRPEPASARPPVPPRAANAALATAACSAHRQRMADLYLKNLESERRQLWATCRLKGLAKDTPERQRIAALDEAIAAHKAKKQG